MQNKILSSTEKIASDPLFLFVLVVATIIGVIEPFRNAIGNQDFGILTFYSVIVCFVVVLAAFLRSRAKRRKQPLERRQFKPFEHLRTLNTWPRTRDQRMLLDTIRRSVRKPVIVVGDSGVGKSVLVEAQVLPVLQKEDWEPIPFRNYSNFQTQIRNELNRVSHHYIVNHNGHVEGFDTDSRKVIIVFDQFEQFLSVNSKNTEKNKECRSWLHNFIESIIGFDNTRMLIVVRKEWYYDLRFLEVFVPPPIECFHLSGMRIDDTEGSVPTLRFLLGQAMKNEQAPETVLQTLQSNGEVSPVEAQIVGCMLENKNLVLGEIDENCYLNQLGGKENLVREFFDTTLRSSPNHEVALQVLFALGIETRYRRHLTLPQVVGMIHQPRDEVRDSVEFLCKQNLISVGEAGHYQLTHDYLAERFHDLSGSELDPRQRDNIMFFGDQIRKEQANYMTTSSSRPKAFKRASDWFMTFLTALVTARLLGPMYGLRWDWFNSMTPFHSVYLGIDTFYIPVFVSHLAWSYYVTIAYRRIFSMLREKPFGRFLSYLTLATCAASVTLAVFLPYFWIFSIGFGGLWIGIKFYQLSTVEGLSTVSKNDFRATGKQTIFNTLFTVSLGGIFGFYIHAHPPSADLAQLFILVSISSMLILTYAMYVATNLHVARRVCPIWIGMYDRRPSRAKEAISIISH